MRLLRIAALLDLDFAVGLRLQDGTKADSEGAKSVGGAAGKERAPSTSRDGRKSRKGADGDENGRKGRHDLRVLVREVLEGLAGVDEPCRDLRYGRHSCREETFCQWL